MTPEEIAEVERPVPMGPGAVWTLTDQKGRLLAEVKRLRAVVDQTIAACSGHLGGLTDELAGAEADRDRARDAAVALEQENAYLTELTATCTCYDGNPANYEGAHADCPVHGAVRAYNETQATVERVRELHAKFVCGCGDDHQIGCKECRGSEYPCPTIRALDGGER